MCRFARLHRSSTSAPGANAVEHNSACALATPRPPALTSAITVRRALHSMRSTRAMPHTPLSAVPASAGCELPREPSGSQAPCVSSTRHGLVVRVASAWQKRTTAVSARRAGATLAHAGSTSATVRVSAGRPLSEPAKHSTLRSEDQAAGGTRECEWEDDTARELPGLHTSMDHAGASIEAPAATRRSRAHTTRKRPTLAERGKR